MYIYIHSVNGATLSPADAYGNMDQGGAPTHFPLITNNLIPP